MLASTLTLLVLFGATLTSSTFGFGGALFSMPLLTLVVGIEVATPLYGLVGLDHGSNGHEHQLAGGQTTASVAIYPGDPGGHSPGGVAGAYFARRSSG